eukprot:s1868_g12.t1
MELVSPIDGEAVVVLSPRAAKPALPPARKSCDPDVIGRLVSLYQGGLEPAHPRLPRSPRSASGSPKRPRPKVRLPPVAVPMSPEQRRSHTMAHIETPLDSKLSEKRDQCSDTCRRMAHRWQKQQRRKASPGAGVPATSAATNENKAALLSVEIPPSPQAPSDISSVEDPAKSPSFKPTPTPTPRRVLRFEALCAAKRRQGRLNLNPSSVAQLQEEYLKQQQLRPESVVEDSGSEDSGATSPTDSWPQRCLTLSRKHKACGATGSRARGQKLRSGASHTASREFVEAIRLKACIPHGLPVPEYLLLKQWACADKDDSGEYNLEIMQIDHLKTVFDKFDADGSGQIDHSEFKDVLCCLLHANPEPCLNNAHFLFCKGAVAFSTGALREKPQISLQADVCKLWLSALNEAVDQRSSPEAQKQVRDLENLAQNRYPKLMPSAAPAPRAQPVAELPSSPPAASAAAAAAAAMMTGGPPTQPPWQRLTGINMVQYSLQPR